jgi:hypothetical protein
MLDAALNEAPQVAASIAQKGAAAFKKWLGELPEGAKALVIGHSPFLELIAYGLFDQKIKALAPCEGFQIIEDRERLSLSDKR